MKIQFTDFDGVLNAVVGPASVNRLQFSLWHQLSDRSKAFNAMARQSRKIGMRPIIFLDIDDVLAVSRQYTSFQVIETFKSKELDGWPELWSGLIFQQARDNLVAMHGEFLPLYVISSSWTNYLNREQFGEIFRRTNLRFVNDNLHEHWTTPKRESSTRLEEIEDWISQHRQPGQPVLVLDDYQSGPSLKQCHLDQQGMVVLCEPWVGFREEKFMDARELLREQIRICMAR